MQTAVPTPAPISRPDFAQEAVEEATLDRPSIRRGEPLYQAPTRRAKQASKMEAPSPQDPAAEPPAPPPVENAAKPVALEPPADSELRPPTPAYPRAQSRSAPSPSAPMAKTKVAPTNASSSIEEPEELGVFFEFSDEVRARPIYAPIIAFDGLDPVRAMYANKELQVRFDLSPNGRFQVRLVEGTGDAELDQRALETLRQWRWRPKTVARRPVGSIEILTLHARVR